MFNVHEPVNLISSLSQVVTFQVVVVVFVDLRRVVLDAVDVFIFALGRRGGVTDLRRCVAVDEVTTQQVAVELQKRQEVVAEVFDVLVLDVELLW